MHDHIGDEDFDCGTVRCVEFWRLFLVRARDCKVILEPFECSSRFQGSHDDAQTTVYVPAGPENPQFLRPIC